MVNDVVKPFSERILSEPFVDSEVISIHVIHGVNDIRQYHTMKRGQALLDLLCYLDTNTVIIYRFTEGINVNSGRYGSFSKVGEFSLSALHDFGIEGDYKELLQKFLEKSNLW